MLSEETHYGSAEYLSISNDYQLKRRGKRVKTISCSVGSKKVKLPDATKMRTGGPHFIIINIGTITFSIADNGGTVLVSVPASQTAVVSLIDNGTVNGSWTVNGRLLFGGPNQGLKFFNTQLTVDTGFTVNATKRGIVAFSSVMTIATGFLAKLFIPSEKLFKSTLQITTGFTAKMGVFPVANIVSSTATGTGDGSLANPWTLKQAAAAVSAGAKVYLRGGLYPNLSNNVIDSSNATVINGTAGNFITYQNYPGEVPELLGPCRIYNSQYLRFKGIKFFSSGKSHISTTTAAGTTRDIEFETCEFDAQQFPPTGIGIAFTGLLFQNTTNIVFRQCKFGKWYSGDFVSCRSCTQILVEDCDFSQGGAPHALFGMLNCGNAWIRRSVFRNPWSRAFYTTRGGAASTDKNILVEDCIFFDSNWDRISPHPGDSEGNLGDTESVRFMVEQSIFRNNLIIGHNPGLTDRSTGQPFSYSCGFELHHYDLNYDYSHVRACHNVIHKSDRCGISMVWNKTSAPNITALDHRFKNNSITEFVNYGINVAHKDLPWESWIFDSNRIYDPAKTKTIFIASESPNTFTVSEAQAANSIVFKNNISNAPIYNSPGAYDTFNNDPSLLDITDLEILFNAFSESPGSAAYQAGKELAKITANGTTVTTLSVDDAYWFMPGTNYYAGDKIYVGSNSAVTVTGIVSATQITVTPAITVAVNDKIYLERSGKMPSIGVYALTMGSSKNFSSTMSVGTSFAAILKRDLTTFRSSMAVGTSFAANMVKSAEIFEITHNGGDLSEYTTTQIGSGPSLVVSTAAALKGAKGLAVTVGSDGIVYGEKDFTWASQYLRARFYIDPNSFTMATSDNFYVLWLKTAGGQSSAYVRIERSSTQYKVYAGMRDDIGNYADTSRYQITDASHYVEVEFKRAANSSSVDGTTKLYIDGTLQETVSSQDVFDVNRPTKCYLGAVNGLDPGTSGTFYLDDLVLRDSSTIIGA